jgi:hypothetical protein
LPSPARTGHGLAAAVGLTGCEAEEEIVVRYVDECDPPHHRPNPRSSVKEVVWRVGRRGAGDGRAL